MIKELNKPTTKPKMSSIQFMLGCLFLFAAVFFAANVDVASAAPFHGHGGNSDVLHMLAAGAVVRMLMENFG
ncbi:hypothetical protein JTE90_002020 [Oedothorax gibbosus]|uniref:Uncharacterized protein n=1 Tax=Oedothorax gibbosus TaxID=931172 RepID=A0AAV6UND5_9ARAC|nr:hypothetical protein JTE90_002020 [Oedothorax gibbosus]